MSLWPSRSNTTYDLSTYLNVKFSALSIAGVKKGVSILKNKVDIEMILKVKFKVKLKVTVGFLVENYFRNDLDLF